MLEVLNNGRIVIDGEESKFLLQEFVPRRVYEFYGNNAIWVLDEKLICLAQFLRMYFNESMTINNWHTGGNFQFRGFRPDIYYYEKKEDGSFVSKKKGKYSQHRYGRAIDWNFSKTSPDEVRKTILANQEVFMDAGLTTIEDGEFSPTWCHGDVRITNMDKIFVVKP